MPTVAMTAPRLRVATNTIGQVVEEAKADPCNMQEAYVAITKPAL